MDPEVEARTEVRDGMRITWHQPIPMDDGIVLRADLFRPIQDGRYPVILTYGIYAKGLAYQDGYPKQWNKMIADHPEILEGSMAPLQRQMEITGPIAAKLFVSSSTRDADLFLIVRVFDPDGKELTFMGSTDPNTPIANGWLRASHRRLDPQKTKLYRPYHPHDLVEPLAPGDVYELDVEILPTCIVVPAGWRVALTVRGKDYEYEGELSEFAKTFHYGTRGTGGMTHADPDSRPHDVFGGTVTLHAGGGRESCLLLPIIPGRGQA